MKKIIIGGILAVILLVVLIMAGCGGSNPAGGGTITKIIGGTTTIPLNLTGLVSSFTGIASTSMTAGAVDGASNTATFNRPNGVTTDGTNLYIADTSNNKIRKIVISTGTVSTLAGTGTAGATDGAGTIATFSSPNAITTDGTNLYIADTGNGIIRKIVISTGVVSTLAGTANVFGSVDGTGTAASFYNINGIITDGTNLYAVDTNPTGGGPSTIRKIVISSGIVSTLAGSSVAAGAIDDIGTAATFKQSFGITTDGTNLYVTDAGNGKIRKIVISTGVVSSLTGIASTSTAIGAVDGASNTASFWSPNGITTDGTNLYISDGSNNKIRKIVISTGVVSSLTGIANTSMIGGTAVDGASTVSSFWNPTGITTDGKNLYISDSSNNKIRKMQ